MSLLALAAAALLTLTDPTGDAAGDGTLEPPTSPVYANAALFDLQEVSVVAGASQADPATLRVAMGAVELDESQPAGFNRSVVDVYLDLAEGGATATLQGPGMLMPPGKGWEYAVRISPRGAFGAPAPFEEGQSVEWSPLDLAIDGDVLVVGLPDGIGPDLDVFALSGVFDAFSPHSWRPLAAAPSPWSYSGTEQVVPVIDLIAADHETQMTA
ncbi:MAG TPA: glucodextranase DOMON-like domain-containing protein, partial [Trueperaceae bacterium]